MITIPKTEKEQRELKERAALAFRIFTAAWFEVHGAIKPKVGQLLKPPDLKANYLQDLESDVVAYCLMNKIPCRILKLKPRQKGSSTFSVANLYRMCCNTFCRGLIIGGAHFQGANLWKMLKTYAENDTFDQRSAEEIANNTPRVRCTVLDREARWTNGSEAERVTAANGEAGRSGTYQVIIATEVARWAEEGVANAADVLAGALKCVADAPMTLIELETTANGASGDFYERWQGGITFEELKAGKRGYVKLFAAWFQFEDSRRDPKSEEGQPQYVPADKVEEVRKKYGLDDWQIAWMQWAVREECKRDFDVFCEDYPFDAESAFRSSGRRRFLAGNVQKMIERAALNPPELGVLESTRDSVSERISWRPCSEPETRVLRWEPPKGNCRYLVSIDSMTGESQVAGMDPDNHAVGVLRAGFFESGRGWVPPKLVARLVGDWSEWVARRKYELRWDIDVLEEQVWRLAQYYGNALIVPEMNADRGLVELLKLRLSARIYEREQFNHREQRTTKALGWYTDQRTREMIVDNLARAIRELGKDGEGIDIHCPITLAELQSFIVKASGRSESMSGKHDDTVLQMAIGLQVIDSATVYHEPVVRVALPRDLLALEKAEGVVSGGIAQRW